MATTQRNPAAVQASATTAPRLSLRSWFANHREVAAASLVDLLRNWVSSLMTWLVIGVALALPAILYLLLLNVSDLSADWGGQPRVSVYLKEQVTDDQARAALAEVRQLPEVVSVRYISPSDALKEFTARSGFGDVLASLDKNPLPPVLVVNPGSETPARIQLLVAKIRGFPAVDSVSVDLAWIQRLYAILSLGERLVGALAFFLGLGVLLSIGNTIRLAIENRRSEIEVVKLVGGTDSFVRRPFLYLGFWYGAGGAVLAWIMIQGSLVFLSGPVNRLIQSYNDTFALLGPGFVLTLVLVAGGGLLGILGAAIAVRRHLHEIEPR